MKRLRIVVGDDHSLILGGVKGLLQDRFDVEGSATDGKALVDLALRLEPDLIVLDISMPLLNGIEAGREIKKAVPSTKLVFLSMHSNPVYLRRAFEAGASAYVLKSGAAEELLAAIEQVMRGSIYISPSFGQNVIDEVKPNRKAARSGADLTARQKQILQLVAGQAE